VIFLFKFFQTTKKKKNLIKPPKKIPLHQTTPRATQQVATGPRRLTGEDLEYNLYLIKKILPDPNLKFANFIIGTRSRTKVVIAYLKDVANSGIVSEIKARLENIKAEIILDTSYIERNIQNSTLSPFPQLEKTKKADVVVSALAQSRIAIIVDGSPDILLAPTTFFDILDTPDDAYRRWFIASSFFRIARLILFLFAAFLPGFYIALTSFNPELIPTQLTFIITSAREGSPFPVYAEAFTMMGVAEAVRMAMLRTPTTTGQTIAIFSGLTLVGAGIISSIVSAPVVMIVTLTIIASFALPGFDLRSSIRMIQFFTMIMATLFGLFGLAIAFFYLTIHLATLKSFGIPYMAPVGPLELSGWGHTIFREPTPKMAIDETYKPNNKQGDNND